MTSRSVSLWLKELRYSTESYESIDACTALWCSPPPRSSAHNSCSSSAEFLYPNNASTDQRYRNDETMNSNVDPIYQNLWECSSLPHMNPAEPHLKPSELLLSRNKQPQNSSEPRLSPTDSRLNPNGLRQNSVEPRLNLNPRLNPFASGLYSSEPQLDSSPLYVNCLDFRVNSNASRLNPFVTDLSPAEVNYARECRVSVNFSERLSELKVLPAVPERVIVEVSADVLFWKNELRLTCEEEDSIMWESEELISSLKIEDNSNNTNQPSKFPSADEPIFIRKKASPNPVRSKTVNYDQCVTSVGKSLEVDDVVEVTVGKNAPIRLLKNEKLIFDEGRLQIEQANSEIKILQDNVHLKSGTTLDKKTVKFQDTNGIVYYIRFKSVKEAQSFAESDCLRNCPSNEKSSIKAKLRRLLYKRSSREDLVEKGIIRNEPIFGNNIETLYNIKNEVPSFLQKAFSLIETEENIMSVGIYRTSGNLAVIQKIRCQVDEGNLEILNKYEKDVDVLTGAVKLFFRELKESLIPLSIENQLLKVTESKHRQIKDIIKELPIERRDTLLYLLRHLIKVAEFKEFNKMDFYNLSICWGPSLMFAQDNVSDFMYHSSCSGKILDRLLNYYHTNSEDLESDVEFEKLTKGKLLLTKNSSSSSSIDIPPKQQKKNSNHSNVNDVHDSIAKLIDLIETDIKRDGLYTTHGVKIEKILKKINKQKFAEIEKSKIDVNDLADAFKTYLNEWPDLFIPKEALKDINCDMNNYDLFKQKIRKAVDSINKKETLILILKHLVRVIQNEEHNKASFQVISIEWRNIIIKPNLEPRIKHKVMRCLLETYGGLQDKPKPMPDVIKDIEARGSKYDNVPSHSKFESVKGEAKILDDKTEK